MPISPQNASIAARKICELAKIVPVITINDIKHAEPLARALVKGGLPALEVTLRTPQALEAISIMSQIKGAVAGAGTLITPKDVDSAVDAGAEFGVSPGATDTLLDACEKAGLPLLPGAATASEAMRLFERGYSMLKFFPAKASGGAAALKSIGAPLPQISFCPTGGVSPENAQDYLSLSNVICAGGSWVVPQNLMQDGNWEAITNLASNAARI